jgi:hypothetical protein
VKFTIGHTTVIVQHTDYIPQRVIRIFVVLGLALWFYVFFQFTCGNHVVSEIIIRPTAPPVRSIPWPTNWNR